MLLLLYVDIYRHIDIHSWVCLFLSGVLCTILVTFMWFKLFPNKKLRKKAGEWKTQNLESEQKAEESSRGGVHRWTGDVNALWQVHSCSSNNDVLKLRILYKYPCVGEIVH